MKYLAWLCGIFLLPVVLASSAEAVEVVDPNQPPALSGVPILVSAFSADDQLNYIELHNQSDQAQYIGGYSISVISVNETQETEFVIAMPELWLLADSYAALSNQGVVSDPDQTYVMLSQPGFSVSRIILNDGTGNIYDTDISSRVTDRWYQRKSGANGQGGTFPADFNVRTYATAELRGRGLHDLVIKDPVVEIVEVHANHGQCAPSDVSISCGDFIKLYNPSQQTIDMTPFRLKSDSGTSSAGNTFYFDNLEMPGRTYLTVYTEQDGDRLNLTNSGGYIWIEDSLGIHRYDETSVSYPDASAESKKGWSWVLDDTSGSWEWTNAPRPNAPNVFLEEVEEPQQPPDGLAPCETGKFRNPETNRCKSIETSVALAPCGPGQERNPDTNRCRSSVATSGSLVPCSPTQERNPETNRCRSIVSASSQLKPCAANQERNPETNRCRNVLGASPAATLAAASNVGGQSQDRSLNAPILGTLIAGAIAYGVYEWREEIAQQYRSLRARVGRK